MKIVDQSWEWEVKPNGQQILQVIERAGRTCYKSEDKITDDSAKKFVQDIIKRGHESVLEHVSLSVRIITDRGVTHEIVRHRLASYSQESTRYCNYGKAGEVTFIRPVWVPPEDLKDKLWDGLVQSSELKPVPLWYSACQASAIHYLGLLRMGWLPQHARTVLNNSLKTEIVMTANLREWRHFFKLRCSSAAHPQMRELALSMKKGFAEAIPVIFDE